MKNSEKFYKPLFYKGCDMAYRGIWNCELLVVLLTGCVLVGCSTYEERVSPVLLPSTSIGHINIRGAKIAATPYVNEKKAKSVFGTMSEEWGYCPYAWSSITRAGKKLIYSRSKRF
ncbi:hypothetical protein [Methylobacter sp.]|uniref:hypothetical protein n=1 Tax=Methylobacter sp. TaxID=2051955 RepID=UPI003DA3F61B